MRKKESKGKNMEWFNLFGLVFIVVIMIPNIVFAIKNKNGFENKWKNKAAEIIEQIGRIGCFVFMIINIPGTFFGWWTDGAFVAYLVIDSVLTVAYCAFWIVLWKKNNVLKALALSVIPSLIFLSSGILSRSVLLGVSAILFAPTHILISYKNAK